MHVVVVGCGRVGAELAVKLDAEDHSVAVIDKNRRAFQRYLPERFSGRAVHGFGFDRDHLEQAGIREAGALAACTGGDNSNILAARIAKETYEIPHVVARIQDPRRAVIYQRLGVPTVAQVAWTTEQVMRRLFEDVTLTEWSDASGDLCLVERILPHDWAGRKLAALGKPERYRLVAVTRAGVSRLAGPDIVGQEDDVVHIIARKADLDDLENRLAAGPED